MTHRVAKLNLMNLSPIIATDSSHCRQEIKFSIIVRGMSFKTKHKTHLTRWATCYHKYVYNCQSYLVSYMLLSMVVYE